MNEEQMVTMKDVAELLGVKLSVVEATLAIAWPVQWLSRIAGVSPHYLRQQIRTHRFPGFKFGNHSWVMDKEWARDWLALPAKKSKQCVKLDF